MYVPIRVVIRLRVKIRILINAARARFVLSRSLISIWKDLWPTSRAQSSSDLLARNNFFEEQVPLIAAPLYRCAFLHAPMYIHIYMPYNIVIQTPVVRECIRSFVKRSHYGRSLMQNNKVDQHPGNIMKYYTADNEVTEPRLSRESSRKSPVTSL